MQPVLHFDINNQIIERTDTFVPVRSSKNYLYAEFDFQTDDWKGRNKIVLFQSEKDTPVPIALGDTDTCLVPKEVLSGTSFNVSVIAGNLLTANTVTVKLYEAGYDASDISDFSLALYNEMMSSFNETKEAVISSAKEAESWAHGRADYPKRNEDNAAYYAKEAKSAAKEVTGRVTEGKREIDRYVRKKEASLKGETGNVYFAAFKIIGSRLIMCSDPAVDKVHFYREGSRLKYRLEL